MDDAELQVRVLERLIAHHPSMRTLEQLAAELEADVRAAVDRLVADGQVTRLGELVGVAWAAVPPAHRRND